MEINWLFESNHLKMKLFYWLDPSEYISMHSFFVPNFASIGNSFRMTFAHPKHSSIYEMVYKSNACMVEMIYRGLAFYSHRVEIDKIALKHHINKFIVVTLAFNLPLRLIEHKHDVIN